LELNLMLLDLSLGFPPPCTISEKARPLSYGSTDPSTSSTG
jgi:hypothetical protein